MTNSTHVVVLSGEGQHSDPWHPLQETSAALAGVLGEENEVTVVTSLDDLGARIGSADVLAVNASADRAEPVPDDAAFGRLLDGFLGRGGGLLAMHSSAVAFPGLPAWRSALGGTWKPGTSFHPPIGRTLIRKSALPHPLTEGLDEFWIFDERYTDLDFDPDVRLSPLYTHTENGATHPLVWTRTVGESRVLYDALGHDVRSFEAPEHVELLRRAVRWLSPRRS
ncbi:ThuA domain-containing protein [Streptomyces sp. NPDC006638]|uniref:ThuA domain-containing protein n=1 Tax=Streptomyces sp. NPDC006638 TaxID=3157183 RepID=UPI0033B198E2